LENRSLLNNRVAKANEAMSDVNKDLIAVNNEILKTNEETLNFNKAQVETNTKLLDGIQADKATAEANKARIDSNKAKITKVRERNEKYNADMADKHAAIKEIRKTIDANADKIKERRKQILANRDGVVARGVEVATLLRGSATNVEDLTKSLADLSDEEKKSLKEALAVDAPAEAVVSNRKNINENEAKLHELHFAVTTNKFKLYRIRSVVEENRALILKNYAAAFIGNRQMINQNTDDIIKNRTAILDAMKTDGQVQENLRNSKYNETHVDFLEKRSLMNNRVQKVNDLMKAANAKLIAINESIMASNEEVVKFNTEQMETNGKLVAGIKDEKATPEANAARIEANGKRIQVIADRCSKYDEKVDGMLKAATENRDAIVANAKDIEERRKKVMERRNEINENAAKVAGLLRA